METLVRERSGAEREPAELPCQGHDLGAVGRAEAAQNVADVLLHEGVKCTLNESARADRPDWYR